MTRKQRNFIAQEKVLTDFAASGKKFDFKSLVMKTVTTSTSVERKEIEKK